MASGVRLFDLFLVLSTSTSAWAADSADQIRYDKNSVFLKSRYETQIATDSAALLTAYELLKLTGHANDAALLHQVVERKLLKRLLGERYETNGTVEQAIRREAEESEQIEALRARVLRAITIAPIRSRPDAMDGMGHDPKYFGNSAWSADRGSGQIAVYLRVRAQNSTTEHVESIDLRVREKPPESKSFLDFTCRPEGVDGIPPKANSPVTCTHWGDGRLAAPFIEGLRTNRIKPPFGAIDGLSVAGAKIEPREVSFESLYEQTAKHQLAVATCTELAICDQIVQRNAKADDLRRYREQQAKYQSGLEQIERERRAHNATLIAGSILVMLLLSGGASFLTRRTKPETQSSLVSGITGLTFLASVLDVVMFVAMTAPGAGIGALAIFSIALNVITPTLLVSVLALGACIYGGHATRFRIFVLVLGILTSIFFLVGLHNVR